MDKSLKIESGLQLFSRVTHVQTLHNLHPVLFPEGGPQPNTLIQITGAESTGKTLLLGELLARCILPKEHEGKAIAGNNSAAVFINLDHQLNLLKLIGIMEALLRGFSAEHVKAIVEASLKRLSVLNCYGSEHLLLTFRNLERILVEDLSVRFLAIDGIVANYWYERGTSGATSINGYIAGVLNELAKVVKGRKLVTAFTKLETEKNLSFTIDFTASLKKINAEDFVMCFYEHKEGKRASKKYRVAKDGLKFYEN